MHASSKAFISNLLRTDTDQSSTSNDNHRPLWRHNHCARAERLWCSPDADRNKPTSDNHAANSLVDQFSSA